MYLQGAGRWLQHLTEATSLTRFGRIWIRIRDVRTGVWYLGREVCKGSSAIFTNALRRKVEVEDERVHRKYPKLIIGRQIAFLIHQHCLINDLLGRALEYFDLFGLNLVNVDVKSFGQSWDETSMAMQKIPDEDLLESLVSIQLLTSSKMEPALEHFKQQWVLSNEPKS